MAIKSKRTPESNVKLATEEFGLIWEDRDLDAAMEHLSRDYVAHLPAGDLDRESFREFVEGLQAAFSDMEMSVEEIFATDELVCLRWSCSGTHEGELMGIEPTGESVEFGGIAIHRIEDGAFVETWGQYDALGMLRQLGVEQLPAA